MILLELLVPPTVAVSGSGSLLYEEAKATGDAAFLLYAESSHV